MRKGLFFGSFNPIHLGHLNIAQYVLNYMDIDKVVFIVSPQNPFKTELELWSAERRLELIRKTIEDNPRLEVSDIEFTLPKPSYTYQTLEALEAQNTGDSFSILMGADTLSSLDKWRNPEKILSYPILVYPRINSTSNPYPTHRNIQIMSSPILEISATNIRQMLLEGKSVKYQVSDKIIEFL